MNLHYSELMNWFAEIGADLHGAIASAGWAEYLPDEARQLPHQSIVVFGAGGPAFIRECQAYAAAHGEPEHWISDYAQILFEQKFGGDSPRYLNPYRTGRNFPFQRAAIAAGLGVKGLNNVVLTPAWGPWFSLLGAIVLDEEIPARDLGGFDPCAGCPAPCLKACPGGAVSRAGYDGYRCIETKLVNAPCLHACPARHACRLRADLRREMIGLEAARRRDDRQARALFQQFLAERAGTHTCAEALNPSES